MFMNVVCPSCGNKVRVPERSLGQQIECPNCRRFFQCGTTSPPSLKAQPAATGQSTDVQEMPAARAAELEAAASIHYRCARCQKSLESPAHLAGQKRNCPECGQRLQIPHASAPPPAAVVPVSTRASEEPILTVLPASPRTSAAPAQPARREYCLECGVEVTQRPRIQTCPDCGSLFCSARCYREHTYHAHPSRR